MHLLQNSFIFDKKIKKHNCVYIISSVIKKYEFDFSDSDNESTLQRYHKNIITVALIIICLQ